MLRGDKPRGKAQRENVVLTWREREVTQLFAEGCSTQQVATRLHISTKTVATHRAHVFRKLNIRGLAELTRFAVKQGMTSLD